MALGDLRILIVDDHEIMRMIVSEILASAGCRKMPMACDGDAAFKEIMNSPPDLAIIDVHMPVSGLALLEKIRHAPSQETAELPVIVVTGFGDERNVLSLRDAGANEIVTKPVSAKAILSRVAAVIDAPRPFVRCASFIGPDRRRKATVNYEGPFRRTADVEDAVYL